MKINRLFLLTLLVLALFTVGAASASDDANATDDAVLLENQDQGSLQVAEDDELSEDPDIYIGSDPEDGIYTFVVGEDDTISVEMPEGVSKSLTVSINGTSTKLYYDEDSDDEYIYVNDTRGSNSVELEEDYDYEISLDKLAPNNIYNVLVKVGTTSESFMIHLVGEGGDEPEPVDEDVEITIIDREFVVGDEDAITVSIDDGITGNLTVKVNGTSAGLEYDGEGKIYVYSSGHASFIQLPASDVDDGEYYVYLDNLDSEKTYNVNVTFETSSGKRYSRSFNIFLTEGDGPEPVDEDVEIRINDNEFEVGNDNAIIVSIGGGITGNLTVKVNGTSAGLEYEGEGDIYVYSSGHASFIQLPKSDVDDGEYYVCLDYLASGKTYNVNVTFETSSGKRHSKSFNISLTGGDEPEEDVVIDFEGSTYVIEEDAIDLTLSSSARGNLTVKLDGKQAHLKYDGDGEIDVYTSGYYTSIYLPRSDVDDGEYNICLDGLTLKTYNVEVTFETTSKTYSKSFTITLVEEGEDEDVDVEIHAKDSYLFNESGNKISIAAHQTIIDNLEIQINGVEYALVKTSKNAGYVDISKLPVGKYTIIAEYGEYSDESSFEVVSIHWPKTISYGSSDYVTLNMPGAVGNLTVKIDGVEIGNVEIVNGYAKIAIPQLGVGVHDIEIRGVEGDEVNDVIEIIPKITLPSQMTAGENKYLTIDVGNLSGTAHIYADYDDYATINVKGNARVSLKNLEDDDVTITVFFTAGDYSFEEDYDILVKSAPIRIYAKNVNVVYAQKGVFEVKIFDTNAKPAANDIVDSIKIGNKVYRNVKTNKNGVAKITIPKTLAPGKYKIITNFEGKIAKNTLTVKHLLKLKKVKVKRSAKKLVLKATLKVGKKPIKGKKVTFKFNGKKVKIKKTVKTNKKGVAKVVIKKSVLGKLKVGKKVKYQAIYLKDVAKKSVKVKK